MEERNLTAKEILVALAIKYCFNFKEIYSRLKRKEEINYPEAIETLKGVNLDEFTSIVDKDYPECFKICGRPPVVFKKTGYDVDLNQKDFIFMTLDGDFNEDTFGLDESKIVYIFQSSYICIGTPDSSNRASLVVSYSLADILRAAISLCSKVLITNHNNYNDGAIQVIASIACELGKDVYVMPKKGVNNNLIKSGCNLCDCKEDLFGE